MDDNLEIGNRYTKVVTFSEWGPGQRHRTANYGAEYIFTLSNGIRLHWDTMSKTIINKYREKDTLTISFKVLAKPWHLKMDTILVMFD